MDFLNKAYTQFSELFRSMTPGARITAGLLTAVVVISLGFLFRFGSNSTGTYLYGGRDFSQSELAAMETAFSKSGLSNAEIVGNRIRVPSLQKAEYMAALLDGNALPARPYSFLDGAMSDSNPFMSSKTLDKKLLNARQQELALIITRMRDIEFATVHYDEFQKPGFPRSTERTATVAVQATGNNRLEEENVLSIRNLVAAAYAGMKQSDVTVTDINGGSYPGGGENGGGGALNNAYASLKVKYENQWRTKITDALRWIPGVIVGVNVDLEKELQRTENRVKLNPKETVSLTTEDNSITSTSNTAAPGGRPGAVPNGVSNQGAEVRNSAASTSETTDTRTKSTSTVSRDYISTTIPGLTPSSVQTSIGIPSSYHRQVWFERNPVADGEDLKEPTADDLRTIETEIRKKVEEFVKSLLPKMPETENPFPRIKVATLPVLATPKIIEPSVASNATTWFSGNWQTMGMILVGLFSLLMLRSMIRSSPPAPTANVQPTPSIQLAAEEQEESEEAPSESRPQKRRFKTSDTNLKDELIDIVREDTEAAAKVLRSWIGDAA